MIATISFSVLFSLGLYVALMALIGPEDNFGEVNLDLCMTFFIENIKGFILKRRNPRMSASLTADINELSD